MTQTRGSRLIDAGIVAACILLPLAGAVLAARGVSALFRFPPPLAIPREYPEFSWIAVALVVAPFAVLAAAWGRHNSPAPEVPAPRRRWAHVFPRWGSIALAWTLSWWLLAWSRFDAFAPYQRYTFFPLWIGFIVLVNAAVVWRRGTCAMLGAPRRWAGLFAASGVFWWLFEWLNRFTHNWHYLGIADFGAGAYAVHATLCFSTVLPAVAAVAELLGSDAGFSERCARGPALPWLANPVMGLLLLALGAGSLVGAGARPQLFYPALWCAPLALVLGRTVLARAGGLPFDVARGDWRVAATWAVAALICGFFWELWNFRSATKWIYTVPYVDRWHVFEMPLLGYFGYLPFGLECQLVAARVLGPPPAFASGPPATPSAAPNDAVASPPPGSAARG